MINFYQRFKIRKILTITLISYTKIIHKNLIKQFLNLFYLLIFWSIKNIQLLKIVYSLMREHISTSVLNEPEVILQASDFNVDKFHPFESVLIH